MSGKGAGDGRGVAEAEAAQEARGETGEELAAPAPLLHVASIGVLEDYFGPHLNAPQAIPLPDKPRDVADLLVTGRERERERGRGVN